MDSTFGGPNYANKEMGNFFKHVVSSLYSTSKRPIPITSPQHNSTTSSTVTKPVSAVQLPQCRRIKVGGDGTFHILQVSVVKLRKWLLTGIKGNIHLASPLDSRNIGS